MLKDRRTWGQRKTMQERNTSCGYYSGELILWGHDEGMKCNSKLVTLYSWNCPTNNCG